MAYFTLAPGWSEVVDEKTTIEALHQFLWVAGIDDVEALHSIQAFRAIHPSASWRDCFVGIATNLYRDSEIVMAERRIAQGAAPTFMYLFTWESPAFEGIYGSCHTFEIPFVFDNVNAAPQLYGISPDPRRYELATNVSKAWTAFAHTGNPSHPSLPKWEPYSLDERATMVLNYTSELEHDPRREERIAFEELRTSRWPKIKRWRSQ